MDKKQRHNIDLSQRLFIELGTSLLIETDEKIKSFPGKLVGMKVGDYLIVEVSGIKSDTITLSKNEPVQVKYINLDDIYTFSSMVLVILSQPGNLVFLQYPDLVESCNIRGHKRIECFLPIQIKINEQQDPGIVTNISSKGCLCMIDQFQPDENINNRNVELLFSYGDLETLSISGEIRNSQIQGSQIKLGVYFDEIDHFSKSILTTLVPALRL